MIRLTRKRTTMMLAAVVVVAFLGSRFSYCATKLPFNPIDRHACVAAAAALVSEYFGKEFASGEDMFRRLGVDTRGEATLDKLSVFFTRLGLKCRAYRDADPRFVKAYLADYDCCIVLVTARGGAVRHAMTLFPGPEGTVVMSDLLTPTSVVSDEFLRRIVSGDAVVMVVSAHGVPSARWLRLSRSSGGIAVFVFLVACFCVALRRRYARKRVCAQ